MRAVVGNILGVKVFGLETNVDLTHSLYEYTRSNRSSNCNRTARIPGKYPDFVPLHVPPCVSTGLYVEASTAFYVDFLQYIT